MEDQLVGTRINRYEILDCISKTELIGLYKAFDTRLERNVTLRLVLHSLDYSEESIAYFINESKSLAKLSHPNIAKVLDFGHEKGNLYLIGEYIPGKTLAELMTGPMPWQNVVETLIPITDALAYAHSKGIIHRDLNPENIMMTDNGIPVLNDFSLVRIIETEETRDMTGTNIGLGSPAYLSPEQGKGMSVDFRSDIYSLGVIFFEMITGQKPFSAKTSMEVVIQHVAADPPKPKGIIPDLPVAIEEIILVSLSKDVNKRYQTMEEYSNILKAALLPIIDHKTSITFSNTSKMPIRVLAIGLSLFVIAVIGLFEKKQSIISNYLLPLSEAGSQVDIIKPTAIAPIDVDPAFPNTEVSKEYLPAYSLPAWPVLAGTAMPTSQNVIDTSKINEIVELARWGNPNVNQFAFVNDDQYLLSATSAGIYYYDLVNLIPKYFFDTKGTILNIAISSDGELLATGDSKGSVALWNIYDGSEIARFNEGSGSIRSLGISPDKSKLASVSSDKTIYVWDLKQNLLLFSLKHHLLVVNKVIFSPDGESIITGGDDFKILVWDAFTGELLKNYSTSHKINDMDISSDGETLAVALNNATIEIWDLREGLRKNKIEDTKIVTPFTHIKFLPNDKLILTGSSDGFARIWNILGSEKIWETSNKLIQSSPVRTIAISKNGTRVAVMFEDDNVEIWDIPTQKLEISKQLKYGAITRAVISPDNRLLAFQYGNSTVEIWTIADSKRRSEITGTLPRGNPISPDNKRILIQSSNLDMYSLVTTDLEHLFTFYDFPKNGSVIYLLDGKIIAASSSQVIKYWSTVTGWELKSNSITKQENCQVMHQVNGSFLAAGSANGVIDTDNNLMYYCQVPRGPWTISEDYTSDGSIIALALENQKLEVWISRSGGQKVSITGQSPGDMLDIAISKDGNILAATSASGTIELYDLTTGELLTILDLHTGPVNQILFSNDGKYMIAGSADGTVRFFGLLP